ncbi:MAG TPA: DUF2934 domain-containing protein [Gemmataceae bacterium]|nr:DUF2934 domain-containing protein [Gemmataceae bacterium]
MSRVVTPPSSQPNNMQPLMVPHEKIAMRAYEKWIKRGRPPGTGMEDWLEAESELKTEMARTKPAAKY